MPLRTSQFFIGVLSLFASAAFTPAIAESGLSLPQSLPELASPSENALGVNEAGIGRKKGDVITSFTALDQNGQTISWDNLLKQAPLLIIFYRGGWCPYCNLQIKQLTETYPQFQKRHILPVLISVDKPEAAALSKSTYRIPFPVLSDQDLKAHQAFDVILKLDDKTYQLYKQYGIVLEEWSGKNHHKIAVASSFIVSRQGKVLWAHTSQDYKTRPSISQLLQVIDSIKPSL